MPSTAEACEVLLRLEQENDVNNFRVGEIVLWPLLRHCIWTGLLQAEQLKKPNTHAAASRLVSKAREISSAWIRNIRHPFDVDRTAKPHTTIFFVSRPVYLQGLEHTNLYFDRIVDPLLFMARHRDAVAKAYIGNLPTDRRLFFPGGRFRPKKAPCPAKANVETVDRWLKRLAGQAGIDHEHLKSCFFTAWSGFEDWRWFGRSMFRRIPRLRQLYLTSWYFPDMMGLTAAAKEIGIAVTDIQHGKQGKYQGMYSWWSRVPKEGYLMMPDRFWCWGRPSCEDILRTSPDRTTHRPVVGGFPWIDWYRTFINPTSSRRTQDKIILFTLQGPQGANEEPIPEFIVDFLKNGLNSDWRIRFRNHPNFAAGLDYCSRRLSGVDSHRFETCDGSRNLYDELLECSHHITAYSSCGYEAEFFGVPTLLFGKEARRIFETDIASGRFAWTPGTTEELVAWLAKAGAVMERGARSPYIESSLSLASTRLDLDFGSAHESNTSVSGESSLNN